MTRRTRQLLTQAGRLHESAMNHYMHAEVARMNGNREEAAIANREAYRLSCEALDLAKDDPETPSLVYFFISAASLAIRVERYDDAIRLLDQAAENSMPQWAKTELDGLRAEVQAAKGERS